MIIAFTGSPGTGKTSLAKALAPALHYPYIDFGDYIKKTRGGEYTFQHDAFLIDEDMILSAFQELSSQYSSFILDSHLSHFLPSSSVSLCVVCICEPRILRQRLSERAYSFSKTQENIDAENFGVCLHEAEDRGQLIFVSDSSHDSLEESLRKLLKHISSLSSHV